MIHIGGLESLSLAQIAEEVNTMVTGVMNGIHHVLPGMRARKVGTIINISSIGDRKPSPGAPVYHACKHAVRSRRKHEHVGGRAQRACDQRCAGTDPHRHSPEDGDQL